MPIAMMAAATVLALGGPQEAPSLPFETQLEAMLTEIMATQDVKERIPYDGVLVLDRGDGQHIPPCGVFAAHIAVKARLATGETTFFYMLWCEAGQPAPPISGLCDFDVRIDNRPPDGFVSGEHDLPREWDGRFDRTYNMIERFDCRITSDSPTIAPPVTTSWELGTGNPEGRDD